MDYNSIDEDDVDNLRLAALMTLKKKSYLSINTGTSIISEKRFPHNIFAHSSARASSYNIPARNNRAWFPSSNKLSSKRSSRHVNLKNSVYSNSNLISIVPSDIECDFYSDSTLTLNSEVEKSSDIHNSSNEVSTKFSRLEHESDSEESDDSDPEINEKEESDDCDILSLGDKDKDLDDLDTLMDIMEAEIADGVCKSSINESSSLKLNNDSVIKNATELNTNRNEQIALNQPKIIEDSESQLNPSKEELESIITLETNTNPAFQSSLFKSSVVLKSPMSFNTKTSNSPYIKYLNRCSTTVGHSMPQHISLSPRKLSPIKEKNLSPVRCSPPKSQNPSVSPKKIQVISPDDRRQSQFVRKSISLKRKSRSPDNSYPVKKSNSPIKKLKRSRQISPTIRCADNNYHLQKTVKLELVDKQVEMRPFDPPLEQVLNVKNLSIQHTGSVDLRTELKRRRALRLNMNELDLKKKSESFYPTRLLQSAIRDAVDSSAHEVKRKKYSNEPGIIVQTEGNSNGRRVVLLSKNQYNYYNDEVDSYSSAKRQKGNCKKVPLHFRVSGVSNNNMKQKGLKKIIRQNINVTDIDQVFDVLIICNFFFFCQFVILLPIQHYFTTSLCLNVLYFRFLIINSNQTIEYHFS